METPKTPELEKIAENNKVSQSIGQFLEWLQSEKSICFCITPETHKALIYDDLNAGKMTEEQYYGAIEDIDEELRFTNTDFAYIPSQFNVEQILAEYFDVDLNRAEKERQGLLDHIRNNNP